MLFVLLHIGCSSWTEVNIDKDNVGLFDGDCWYGTTDPVPPSGALDHGVKASDIYVGAEDLPYDGIDANCDGKDDFDADGDGFVPEEYAGIQTLGLENTGVLPSGDCLDDPSLAPADFAADRIFPDAEDEWYDGVDSNCDGKNDFDADEDGFESSIHVQADGSVGDDCDDTDLAINPVATEICDEGIDNDCDGLIDDLDSSLDTSSLILFYVDLDADAFGDITDGGQYFCSAPTGFVENNTDCNDADSLISPDGVELAVDGIDQNCDGLELCFEDLDGDGFGADLVEDADFTCSGTGLSLLDTDCDDFSSEVSPDAEEVAGDALDSNCDEIELCFQDSDSDGYRTDIIVESTYIDCTGAAESLLNAVMDCDDNASDTFPGSAHLDSATVCMKDSDGDGYGDVNITGSVIAGTDCNDDALTGVGINPGATEVCDSIDNDCDGLLDDADDSVDTSSLPLYYTDSDSDGFGDENDAGIYSCSAPVGFVINNTDCNDSDDFYNPNTIWYLDSDGDTFGDGDITNTTTSCTQPTGYVLDSTDCNDLSNAINPNAVETAGDEVDSNCDERELCYQDLDSDGYRTDSTNLSDNIDCSGLMEALVGVPNGDCDDSSDVTYPGIAHLEQTNSSACMKDSDGDGFGDVNITGSVIAGTDCNDDALTGGGINPGATEVCDSIDNDCDGLFDDADESVDTSSLPLYYTDSDSDGFGDENDAGDYYCSAPVGFVLNNTDCNDSDGFYNPNTVWYLDSDGDIFGDSANTTTSCAQPSGYVLDSTDCNDALNQNGFAINPNAVEIAGDGVDSNCDGSELCYQDLDSDGYRTDSTTSSTNLDCSGETEALIGSLALDCDDDSDVTYPGIAHLEQTNSSACMKDSDGDGFGDNSSGSFVQGTDCNDLLDSINPAATEICDGGVDNDCDGLLDMLDTSIDMNSLVLFYPDNDSDGYGDSTDSGTLACSATNGRVLDNTDCDDGDGFYNPDTIWYLDSDGDTFGDSANTTTSCAQPSGYVLDSTDCNDALNQNGFAINPNAVEIAGDGVDSNCDGSELCYQDLDSDGYRTDSTTSSTNLDCSGETEALIGSLALDCDDDSDVTYPGIAHLEQTNSSACMKDSDGDGFGDNNSSGSFVSGTDCNDENDLISPDATEICDEIDNNCDELIDDSDPFLDTTTLLYFYVDQDNDEYGDVDDSGMEACTAPEGYVENNIDCDDSSTFTHPNIAFNEVDSTDCMKDSDGDGFGDNGTTGLVVAGTDCNDSDNTYYPDAPETKGGDDTNCDGFEAGKTSFPGLNTCYSKISGTIYFLLCETNKTWNEARAYCEAFGYEFASIRNQSENSDIDVAIDTDNNDYWLGFYDNDSSSCMNYVWNDDHVGVFQKNCISSNSTVYTNWSTWNGADDPDENNGCAAINKYGTWQDFACSDTNYFICSHRP